MRKLIIVTGSGRSGTSAVARVLHESGIPMGRHLFGAVFFNQTGLFEEQPVVAVNDKVLRRCGVRLSGGLVARAVRRARRLVRLPERPFFPRRVPSRAEVIAAAAPHARRMRELAAAVPEPGGWKDPQFAWTLEAWLPHFAQPPRVVVCLRSPQAVAGSTLDVYGVTDDERRQAVLRFWSHEYARLIEVVHDRRLEATCIEYDELVTMPAQTVERLAAFLGHPLDPQYVEPSLQHQPAGAPEQFADLYERVKALSR